MAQAFRSGNPALSAKTFQGLAVADSAERMSLQGTVNRAAILLLLAMIPAALVWGGFLATGSVGAAGSAALAGSLLGLAVGVVTVFRKTWAPVTAPIYALLEGLVLGGLSSILETSYPGIVLQAVGLTFGVFLALLLAYTSRLIPVTQNFRLGVVAATGGIAVTYLLTLGLGLFGVRVPFIHEAGLIGIVFSLVVILVAALNLVLDFDFIESGVAMGAPKYMEWYAAFGLIVTLIWLYFEILHLLAKLRSRN